MDQVHTFDCLDPRDRVHALTGIFPQLKFRIDYSKSVRDVCISVAAHLVALDRHCFPALLMCAARYPSTVLSWPTWVPDWRNRALTTELHDLAYDLSAKHLQLPYACINYIEIASGDPSTLTACGPYVGFIAGAQAMYRTSSGVLAYPIINESGDLAVMELAPHYTPLVGDLVFDLGTLLIVRPVSNFSVHLVASALYFGLCYGRNNVILSQHARKRIRRALRPTETLTSVGTLPLKHICDSVDGQLALLQGSFGCIDGMDDLLSTTGEVDGDARYAQHYAQRPKLPQAKSLVVFDIV